MIETIQEESSKIIVNEQRSQQKLSHPRVFTHAHISTSNFNSTPSQHFKDLKSIRKIADQSSKNPT